MAAGRHLRFSEAGANVLGGLLKKGSRRRTQRERRRKRTRTVEFEKSPGGLPCRGSGWAVGLEGLRPTATATPEGLQDRCVLWTGLWCDGGGACVWTGEACPAWLERRLPSQHSPHLCVGLADPRPGRVPSPPGQGGFSRAEPSQMRWEERVNHGSWIMAQSSGFFSFSQRPSLLSTLPPSLALSLPPSAGTERCTPSLSRAPHLRANYPLPGCPIPPGCLLPSLPAPSLRQELPLAWHSLAGLPACRPSRPRCQPSLSIFFLPRLLTCAPLLLSPVPQPAGAPPRSDPGDRGPEDQPVGPSRVRCPARGFFVLCANFAKKFRSGAGRGGLGSRGSRRTTGSGCQRAGGGAEATNSGTAALWGLKGVLRGGTAREREGGFLGRTPLGWNPDESGRTVAFLCPTSPPGKEPPSGTTCAEFPAQTRSYRNGGRGVVAEPPPAPPQSDVERASLLVPKDGADRRPQAQRGVRSHFSLAPECRHVAPCPKPCGRGWGAGLPTSSFALAADSAGKAPSAAPDPR